jgi:hypothetical protein
VAQTIAVLDEIKRRPAEKVRLVFGTFSKPVRLRNLSVTPHTDFVARTMSASVRFGVVQAGVFDFRVG